MSDHPYVPLPAGSVLGKSFEYGIDVNLNLGASGAPSWQPIRRISAFAPTFPPVTTDISSYDDRGAENSEVTGRSFAASFTVQGNRSTTTGLFLPELEAIIAAARGIGTSANLEIRFYHKPDAGVSSPTDAGRILTRVEATRQNTGNADAEIWSVTLTGKGRVQPIANPFTGWTPEAPKVAAVTPAAAAAGKLVTITGAGFLGATAVKFGADTAAEFTVVNGATILAVMPAGAAGAAPVMVTTPVGDSPAFAYTRG
jgi:hypothetical protein